MPPLVLELKNKIDKFLTNLTLKRKWGTEGEKTVRGGVREGGREI